MPHNKVRLDQIKRRKEAVYEALKASKDGLANSEQLAKTVRLSRRATLELLQMLRREGLVDLYGSSRAVRWGLK